MAKSKGTTKGDATLEARDADAAQAAGFLGRVPDPTPSANYSAAQTDAPTLETDAGLREQADVRMAGVGAAGRRRRR